MPAEPSCVRCELAPRLSAPDVELEDKKEESFRTSSTPRKDSDFDVLKLSMPQMSCAELRISWLRSHLSRSVDLECFDLTKSQRLRRFRGELCTIMSLRGGLTTFYSVNSRRLAPGQFEK